MATVEPSKLSVAITEHLKRLTVIRYDTATQHISFLIAEGQGEQAINLSTDTRTDLLSFKCSEDALRAFVRFAEALTGCPFAKHSAAGEPGWRYVRREPFAPARTANEVDTDRVLAETSADTEGTDRHQVPAELLERTRHGTGEVVLLEPPSERRKR